MNALRYALITSLLLTSSVVAEEFPRSAGIHEQTITLGNNITLRYTLAIPEDLTSNQPVPLVLALHYGGTVTPFYGKGVLTQLVEPALRDLGAVMVAPDCPAGSWSTPDSDASVMLLLAELMQHYAIDKSRVLVTGYSMGGIGSWHFAARHADFFSAAIPIAGTPPPGIANANPIAPLYVLHSRQDELFPLDRIEQAVKQLNQKGQSAQLVAFDGPGHYEIAGFVPQLKAAVPWIRRVWNKTSE